MTKDEAAATAALKLALEALMHTPTLNPAVEELCDDAIDAIKEALALTSTQCEKQPAQEPIVGTKIWFEDGKIVTQNLRHSDVYAIKDGK